MKTQKILLLLSFATLVAVNGAVAKMYDDLNADLDEYNLDTLFGKEQDLSGSTSVAGKKEQMLPELNKLEKKAEEEPQSWFGRVKQFTSGAVTVASQTKITLKTLNEVVVETRKLLELFNTTTDARQKVVLTTLMTNQVIKALGAVRNFTFMVGAELMKPVSVELYNATTAINADLQVIDEALVEMSGFIGNLVKPSPATQMLIPALSLRPVQPIEHEQQKEAVDFNW